jgi:hypothetical protein
MNEMIARKDFAELWRKIQDSLIERYSGTIVFPRVGPGVFNPFEFRFTLRKQPIWSKPPDLFNANLPPVLETTVVLDRSFTKLAVEHLKAGGQVDVLGVKEGDSDQFSFFTGDGKIELDGVTSLICDPIYNAPGSLE